MLTRRTLMLATLGIGGTATMAADDLTSLFTSQPDTPDTPMRYRQGVIREWNPITLENKVQVGKTLFVNLPVLGVAEAASFTINTTVGLAVVEHTWAIIGRFVIPGTDDAEDAITQLGQRAHTATVLTQQATSSTSFVDLATVGPAVTVLIAASGKAKVTISAQFAATVGPLTAGSVGVEVSGATSIAANSQQSLLMIADQGGINATRVVLFEGLPAGGSCTFTLKYSTGGASVDFSNRDITVETL